MGDEKFLEWVQLAVENEDFDDYTVHVQGQASQGDGYLGNITFVKVEGKTRSGQEKLLDLVIKWSKESEQLRKQTPIRECFEKEIFIFNKVNTLFEAFQKEKTQENLLDFMPRIYASLMTGSKEMLILENLKTEGYDVWDRKVPMTPDHFRLVLEAYGRWHAFSFALNQEKPEEWTQLLQNQINVYAHFFEMAKMGQTFYQLFSAARDNCVSVKEEALLEKLQFSKGDIERIFLRSFDEDADTRVILHGDCWNNNYMFKTHQENARPSSVRVIDFQLSGFGSPVLDLSYFIYCCCPTGSCKNEELLKIYHRSLSHCLDKLGLKAGGIFSYDTLLKHWKKFSSYGLIGSALMLTLALEDAGDATDLEKGTDGGKEFADIFSVKKGNQDAYDKRMRDNFVHYVESLK